MTIALVQQATGGTGSSSLGNFTVTLGSAPIAGHALVAFVWLNSAIITVSSLASTSATWSRIGSRSVGTTDTIEAWIALNLGASPGSVVTVTTSAGSWSSGGVLELSLTASSSALDVSGTTSGSTSPMGGVSLSPTNSGDILITGACEDSASGSQPTVGTPTNSWTALTSPADVGFSQILKARWAYLLPAALGTFSTAWSLSASENWAGLAVAILPSGAAPNTARVFSRGRLMRRGPREHGWYTW